MNVLMITITTFTREMTADGKQLVWEHVILTLAVAAGQLAPGFYHAAPA